MSYKHESTNLNSLNYCYVSQTIQIKHQSILYTELNDQTVLFQTIQLACEQS